MLGTDATALPLLSLLTPLQMALHSVLVAHSALNTVYREVINDTVAMASHPIYRTSSYSSSYSTHPHRLLMCVEGDLRVIVLWLQSPMRSKRVYASILNWAPVLQSSSCPVPSRLALFCPALCVFHSCAESHRLRCKTLKPVPRLTETYLELIDRTGLDCRFRPWTEEDYPYLRLQ